jgi:chaperonin GroEL (HSP60 family)
LLIGIKEVIQKSSDVIKAFIEKVRNNAIVVKLREKLKLDEKLSADKFKQFFKIKTAKGVAKESINYISSNIISEATKLSKTEEAITDPKELEEIIQKYEDAMSGKTPIVNPKTNKQLSANYCKEKLRLLKKKLQSLNSGNTEETNKPESAGENKPVGQITADSKRNN